MCTSQQQQQKKKIFFNAVVFAEAQDEEGEQDDVLDFSSVAGFIEDLFEILQVLYIDHS
jgi:hypothetical protein